MTFVVAQELEAVPHSAALTRWPSQRPGTPCGTARCPMPKDQINLTDEDSRIMPEAGGGFEQCYNAQAVVRPKAFW
jgi:hypothetical protein